MFGCLSYARDIRSVDCAVSLVQYVSWCVQYLVCAMFSECVL